MRHASATRLAALERGTLSPGRERATLGHLAGCERCARALDRVRVAQAGLRAATASQPLEPTPAAEARAEAIVRWTRPHPRTRRPGLWLRWAAASALVAGAGAVALVAGLRLRAAHKLPPTVAAAPSPPPVTPRLEALVTLMGGPVELERAGEARTLDVSTALGAGDKLTTRASARVAAQWSEGSGFLLAGDARLELSRLDPRTQRLALERGRLSVRVGPHEPGESLAVTTPEYIVSVHGTWFTVASEPGRTVVEVLEGTVEVRERDGGEATLLHAPARAAFTRSRSSTAALSGHEAARLRAASEMNLLPWLGLDAARAATGSLVVASAPEAELTIDGIELGPTPLALRRALGRHYVELTRPRFQTLSRWVTVGREPGALKLAMARMPEPARQEVSVPVEIEAMVRGRAPQIRACYERRLKRDPSLAGTVSLRLAVGDAGQVRAVTVEESTVPDPLVADCLRREAAGWSFAVGRNSTVVYPFVFRSQ